MILQNNQISGMLVQTKNEQKCNAFKKILQDEPEPEVIIYETISKILL